jgi:hypothetical protein
MKPAARHLFAACAAFLVLFIGGCSSEPPTTPASPQADDAMIKYTQCMRDHGVKMSDPKPGGGVSIDGGDLSQDEMQAAEKDCEELRRLAIPDADSQPLTEVEKQRVLDMTQCMRDKGHDMPDPVFDGNGVSQQDSSGGSGADPNDTGFQNDMARCAKQSGAEGGSGSSANG